jgi:hypothetical protein
MANSINNIVPFKPVPLKEKHKGKSLCKSGFHKWIIKTTQQFDVKKGKLITLSICKRCGEKKIESR